MDKSPVYIPGGHNHRRRARRTAGQGQKQHGLEALAGPLCRIKGPLGTEKRRSIGLTSGDDAVGLIERVGAGNLRNIQALTAQHRHSLMAGHMEPGGALGGVALHKLRDGRIHYACPSWARAAWIIMAHSIRLRNSSHPGSYTPRMEPVA